MSEKEIKMQSLYGFFTNLNCSSFYSKFFSNASQSKNVTSISCWRNAEVILNSLGVTYRSFP